MRNPGVLGFDGAMASKKKRLMSGALLGAGMTALTVKTALAGSLAPAAQPALNDLEKAVTQGSQKAIHASAQLLDQAQSQLEQAATRSSVPTPPPTHLAIPAPARTPSAGSPRPIPDLVVPSQALERDAGVNRISSRALARRILYDAAVRHGLDPKLVLALSYWESGWDQTKISVTGAVGLMQVEPASAQSAGPSLLGRSVDINDPYDNADVGAAILREDLDNFGDTTMGVAAYYQGPDSLRQNGMLPDTQQYVQGILALAQTMN